MFNLSTVLENLRLEYSNGMVTKKLLMTILFVSGFLLGKLSLPAFVAYTSDKLASLFPGDEENPGDEDEL